MAEGASRAHGRAGDVAPSAARCDPHGSSAALGDVSPVVTPPPPQRPPTSTPASATSEPWPLGARHGTAAVAAERPLGQLYQVLLVPARRAAVAASAKLRGEAGGGGKHGAGSEGVLPHAAPKPSNPRRPAQRRARGPDAVYDEYSGPP